MLFRQAAGGLDSPPDPWKPFSLRPSPPTQQGPRPGPPKGSTLVDACRAQLRSTAIVGGAVVSRGGVVGWGDEPQAPGAPPAGFGL